MSLLEQAIIDAQELKEAALKSAESAILEKYSADIKEAVGSMLEQEEEEEDPFALAAGISPEEELLAGLASEEAGEEGEPVPEEEIPFGAEAELKLCPCPDDDAPVEISFKELELLSQELAGEEGAIAPQEELAMAMGAEEEEEDAIPMMESIELDDLLEACGEMMPMDSMEHPMEHEEDEGGKTIVINLEEQNDMADPDLDPAGVIDTPPAAEIDTPTDAELERQFADITAGMEESLKMEDIQITEAELADMVREAVKIDVFEETSEDWTGQTMATKKEDADKHGAELTQNTTDEDMSIEEEAFAMRTGLQEAKKEIAARDAQVEDLKERLQTLAESSDKLKKTFMLMREQFEETNLSNAKLLYTNRTLKSTSLNERQKNRIVESIQSADTIEEAKVIYETLQSAVGGSSKSTPKSLNEAIKRPSMSVPRRRRENSTREIAVKDRFQALAGIKK